MSNVRILYGNPVFRELLEVELEDDAYKFKMHALITNPNYTNKKLIFLLFINNRLVESSCKFLIIIIQVSYVRIKFCKRFILAIRKMLEELYTFYLPKKAHPWCYVSLEINPQNVDVNVHPTKHEVRFLHENSIIERMKLALDEKLSGNSASRTFYVQARLPKADITKEVLKEVLPEYEKDNNDKIKKVRPQDMIRTDASDQKLDKFNFTIHTAMKCARNDNNDQIDLDDANVENTISNNEKETEKVQCIMQDVNDTEQKDTSTHTEAIVTEESSSPWSNIINNTSPSILESTADESNLDLCDQNINEDKDPLNNAQDVLEITNDENEVDDSMKEDCIDVIADKARKQVYKCFGNKSNVSEVKMEKDNVHEEEIKHSELEGTNKSNETQDIVAETPGESDSNKNANGRSYEFKSYSINNFRREVKLTSVLKLRKEVEDACHDGLKQILSELSFIGCIDQSSALIQSGVNLYLCDTQKLA